MLIPHPGMAKCRTTRHQKQYQNPNNHKRKGRFKTLQKAAKKPALPPGFVRVISLSVAHDAIFKRIPIHSKTSLTVIVACWTHFKITQFQKTPQKKKSQMALVSLF
jgi:hypothetical protein